jgi:hypothetical protein
MKVLFCCVLLLVGCARKDTTNLEKPEPAIKKLLARTDVVLIKHFYGEQAVFEDKTTTDEIPGHVSVQAVWVYQPQQEKSGQKGCLIEVAEGFIFSEYATQTKGSSFLDLDELKDLQSALAYLNQPDSPWRHPTSSEYVETSFVSKDSFSASAFHGHDGDSLAVYSEQAKVFLPISKLPELQKAVDSAIHSLGD